MNKTGPTKEEGIFAGEEDRKGMDGNDGAQIKNEESNPDSSSSSYSNCTSFGQQDSSPIQTRSEKMEQSIDTKQDQGKSGIFGEKGNFGKKRKKLHSFFLSSSLCLCVSVFLPNRDRFPCKQRQTQKHFHFLLFSFLSNIFK